TDLGKGAAGHQRDADHRRQPEGEDGECASDAFRGDPEEAGSGTERIVSVLKRKLWLLNCVLIAAIAAGAWQVRKDAQEFRKRERMTLAGSPPAPAPFPLPPAAPPQSVTASSYLDIAQKMLWSKDRNSQVIVDPPKKQEVKPLPPLPGVHGVMNFDGPLVMMSEKPGARQRGVRPGEKIGDFKLVSVDSEQLTLAFEDRTVTKKLDELFDRGAESGQAAAAAPAQAASNAPATPVIGKAEPGAKLTDGLTTC